MLVSQSCLISSSGRQWVIDTLSMCDGDDGMSTGLEVMCCTWLGCNTNVQMQFKGRTIILFDPLLIVIIQVMVHIIFLLFTNARIVSLIAKS